MAQSQSERVTQPPDAATVHRAGQLLHEIAATDGMSGKAVQKVRYLNELAKNLKANSLALARLLNPLAALKCLCIPITNANAAARAAAYRALRYLMFTQELHDAVLDMRMDIFIVRSLDQEVSKESERLQAIKLARAMMLLQPLNFPLSFGRALVAIGESNQDNLSQSALSILCELTVLNPRMASICGGIRAIHMGIVANHNNVMLQRLQKTYGTAIPTAAPLNEVMTLTLLRLYNSPETRCYLRQDVELETMIAPLLDVHYKHSAESADGTSQQAQTEKLAHINASQMSVLTMFRTWQGLMYLCRPSDKNPLQALVDVLPYPEEKLQMAVLNVTFSVFHLKIPMSTADFGEALATCSPSEFQEEWQLDQGWVVEEARALLPRRSSGRVNLLDQYHAVLLQAFLSRNLLERLVEVALSKVPAVSIKATVLLGELLHLANLLLPIDMACSTHALPTLVSVATDFRGDEERRNRANSVINNLDYLHQQKKVPRTANSLYINLMQRQFQQADTEKRKSARLPEWLTQELDDAQLLRAVQKTNVSDKAEFESWDWSAIDSLFRQPNLSIRRLEDQHPKFVKRMVTFYFPGRNQFSAVPICQNAVGKYSAAGLQFFQCMLSGLAPGDEAPKCLMDLVQEMSQCLNHVVYQGESARNVFTPNSLRNSLSRDYFLFFAALSGNTYGVQLLEKCNVFRDFLELCELEEQEELQRLLISSLDYSRDGHGRIILSKLLTNSCEPMRLYATGHLRVLLRAKVPFFHTWCMEMLAEQLCDTTMDVAMEALDVLDEACEDDACLHSLVTLQPNLLHLGQSGRALLSRFVTITSGLKLLKSLNFIDEEMWRWFKEENKAYVGIVEYRLSQSMTSFKLQPEGQYTRRSHNDKQLAKTRELLVPIHFYGQMVQQREGFEMLLKTGHLEHYVELLQSFSNESDTEQVLAVKTAVWALCHLGITLWGLKYLTETSTLDKIVEIIETSSVCTLRGTCVLALSLVAHTSQGCEALAMFGFKGVRHSSDALWPVTAIHNPSATSLTRSNSEGIDGSTSESGDETTDGLPHSFLSTPTRPIRRSMSSADSRSSTLSMAFSAQSIVDDNDGFSPDDVDAISPTTPSKAVSSTPYHGRVTSLRSYSTSVSLSHSASDIKSIRSQLPSVGSTGTGGKIVRRKASLPARKNSLLHVGSSTGSFIGVCLPEDISRLFRMDSKETFRGSLADSLQDPLGLRFDSFHDKKECFRCIHMPSKDAEKYAALQQKLDGQIEKGPLERSSYKSKDSNKETDDGDEALDFEGQSVIRRDFISAISKLSGAVGSRNNQMQIISIKDKHRFVCKDLCLYSQVAGLLEYYHFRVHVRRFIQHLYDEADFSFIFKFSTQPSLADIVMASSSDA